MTCVGVFRNINMIQLLLKDKSILLCQCLKYRIIWVKREKKTVREVDR